ncbi:MAG: LacI family DNA-binding transcriptional regulator [Victivallales bacterium]|nr:LacI family DNA-binding transcriptional regulator [Victivallales bacterium]
MINKTTINDVAQKAGVSKAAASTALSAGKSNVRLAPATRERILAAARELNYTPNIMARGLNRRKSFLLGIYFGVSNWHVASRLIWNINKICHSHGYSLIVYPSTGLEEELANLKLGLERRLDGILAMPLIFSQDKNNITEYRRIAKIIPVVQVLSRLCPELPIVKRDYRQMGKDAVDYLIRRGHRRIGLITFPDYKDSLRWQNANLHYQGYLEAMRQAGLKTEVYPINYDEKIDSAYKDSGKILASAYAPTALIAIANGFAYGAITYFRECGIKVPEDISILGCGDDCYMAESIMPKLTCFPITFEDLGNIAVQKCLNFSESDSADTTYINQTITEGTSVCEIQSHAK